MHPTFHSVSGCLPDAMHTDLTPGLINVCCCLHVTRKTNAGDYQTLGQCLIHPYPATSPQDLAQSRGFAKV